MKYRLLNNEDETDAESLFTKLFLKCRIDLQMPSNDEEDQALFKIQEREKTENRYYEDDVNEYIVQLLISTLDNSFYRGNSHLLFSKSWEVREKSAKTKSLREKARLFRVNGDNILLRLGIFHEGLSLMDRIMMQDRSVIEKHLNQDRDILVYAGGEFYSEARTYYSRSSQNTTLIDVMQKLSEHFLKFSIITTELGMRLGYK